jgi:hypothetical protein
VFNHSRTPRWIGRLRRYGKEIVDRQHRHERLANAEMDLFAGLVLFERFRADGSLGIGTFSGIRVIQYAQTTRTTDSTASCLARGLCRAQTG